MTDKKSMWQRDMAICDDDATFTQNKLRFLENHVGEAITFSKKYNIRVKPLELVNTVCRIMQKTTTTGVYHNSFIVEGFINQEPVLATVTCKTRSDDESAEGSDIGGRTYRDDSDEGTRGQGRVVTYFVEACGARALLQKLFEELDGTYIKENLAQVKWWYQETHGPSFKNVFLNPVTTVLRPEFYPTLQNPREFLERYLASDASVLLAAGPPGTGKTTLLRHLVSDFKLAAHIVYDETMMEKDTVFQNFLFAEESDILIIEDADVILSSRERTDNKLMARFLSVSDGLIKLPNKKLVFTTNLTDFNQIDQALVRPGRLFAMVHTRELTYPEAKRAATVAGLPIPMKEKEYTIAELFNHENDPVRLTRAGFRG